MSSQTFADLGVSSAVLGALNTRGIKEPFPVQRLAVPDVLAGHDVLSSPPPARARRSPSGSRSWTSWRPPIRARRR